MIRKTAIRIMSTMITVVMLLSVLPANAFAAISNWEDKNVVYDSDTFGTNGYYNVISKKDYSTKEEYDIAVKEGWIPIFEYFIP